MKIYKNNKFIINRISNYYKSTLDSIKDSIINFLTFYLLFINEVTQTLSQYSSLTITISFLSENNNETIDNNNSNNNSNNNISNDSVNIINNNNNNNSHIIIIDNNYIKNSNSISQKQENQNVSTNLISENPQHISINIIEEVS